MGVAHSKSEEDKSLILCRERRRFIRQAIDERSSLAAAYFSYVQSLTSTGIALRKFVQPEVVLAESSLYTSTSATSEPFALTDGAISHFSNSSSSLSQHAETAESFSPVPSPISSGHLYVNHMKSGKATYTTVKEKPPTSMTANLQRSSEVPKRLVSELDAISSFEAPPTPTQAQPWDYFGLFHQIENQISLGSGRGLHGLDNADEIKRLREEEGIPELEEEGDRASTSEKNDLESENDFDQPSSGSLVQMFKNRNLISEHQFKVESLSIQFIKDNVSETNHQNEDYVKLTNGMHETNETPEITSTSAPFVVALPIHEKPKETDPETNHEEPDLFSCMKEIEELFLKASESGKEVLRMLETNKVQFRPIFSEQKASEIDVTKISNAACRLKTSEILTACLACCKDVAKPQDRFPAKNGTKYISWHRSMSSLSSSSRNLLDIATNDDTDDLSNNLFHSTYMNSGSHASTLDRLYAWERKLYDEVKASGMIRREYDMKCRQLRHRESMEQNPIRIDKIRAIVKDLHSRIRVAIQRIDSISKKIEEIRDKELQPQLEELIGGLIRMWTAMLNCHKRQYAIIVSACDSGSTNPSVPSELRHQITILLQCELNSLRLIFIEWMSAHKSYLTAINGWLHKCIDLSLKQNRSSRRKPQPFCPKRAIAPPIFVTCRDWLLSLEQLPAKEVVSAVKDMAHVIDHFLPNQEKGRGLSKASLTLSLALKEKQNETGEHIGANVSSVDWSLNYDHFQSALTIFIDRLKTFAESSVAKYEALQQSISEARDVYERSGSRTRA